MSEFIRILSKAELPGEGEAREVPCGARMLCLANVNGAISAMDNVCPHRGGPLAEGTIEAGKVVCPWHQWEFDLATGAATGSPGMKAVSYALRLDGEDVLAEI
jgi:nitrite reductase (NADH) small subunit